MCICTCTCIVMPPHPTMSTISCHASIPPTATLAFYCIRIYTIYICACICIHIYICIFICIRICNAVTAHHTHHPIPQYTSIPLTLQLPSLVVRMSLTIMCQRVGFWLSESILLNSIVRVYTFHSVSISGFAAFSLLTSLQPKKNKRSWICVPQLNGFVFQSVFLAVLS